MSIKSGRQFRSYIISWFLMIVGIIVIAGSKVIFDQVQAYLVANYQTLSFNQLNTLAASLDNREILKYSQVKVKQDVRFQQLVNAFSAQGDEANKRPPLFTLRYSEQKEKLFYAIAPQRLISDAIRVQGDNFSLLVSSTSSGKLQVTDETLVINIQAVSEKPNSTESPRAKVEVNQDMSVLWFKGKKLLNIKNSSFKASWAGKAVKGQRFKYLSSKSLMYPPGTELALASELKKRMLDSLKLGKSFSIKLSPAQAYSDILQVVPLVNQGKGQLTAVMTLLPAKLQQGLSDQLLKSLFWVLSLSVITLLLAAIFFARKITRPLEQLNSAIERLIHNDFNFKLSPKGFGSFRFLALQFNQMLAHLQKSRNKLISLNKSYSRFVPHQLLKQLGASDVSEISLGDCCEQEMTVLFCDIRGFTSISESMTPQANFNFINRYLSQIAPVINKHGGIIDKYLGDGIMALFPNGADAAVKAAVQMLRALEQYNQKLQQKNLPLIEVGLGIHSGSMMLGTVGTSSRMDATVVSDTVNAAARVEAMTKAFSTKILITEETKRQLEQLSDYRMRFIAACRIRGKSKPVTLYEVYNSDTPSLQKEKAANQPMMIRAWKLYQQGNVAAAIALYQKLIEKSPDDKSLFALIERCQSGRL